MKVLITGGAGFIGSRIVRKLSKQNSVVVYDNYLDQVHAGNSKPDDWLDGSEVVRGDIREADKLHRTIGNFQPELVYHLAAETGTGQSYDEPARYTAVNVQGTSNLIEAVRSFSSVKRIIVASSRSIYGEGSCINKHGVPTVAVERSNKDLGAGIYAPRDKHGNLLEPVPTDSNFPANPMSIYASTKLMQEYLLRQAFWGTDIEVGILRLQNVYGPGQSLNNPYTGVISIFLNQIRQGKVLDIYEDGKITRDFVFIDDVVDAFITMGINKTCPDTVLDIGTGIPITIIELTNLLFDQLDTRPNYTITGNFRPGDIRYAVAQIEQAKKLISWEPRISIKEGLKRFVDWSNETK